MTDAPGRVRHDTEEGVRLGFPRNRGGMDNEKRPCQRHDASTTVSSARAVRIVRETQNSIAEVARDLGMNPQALGQLALVETGWFSDGLSV